MTYRLATQSDKDAVLSVYESVKGDAMCTWSEVYPTETEFDIDVGSESLYMFFDRGELIGVASIVAQNELDDLSYWHCHSASEIARIAVAPKHRGHGYAKQMMLLLESIIKQNGKAAVHLLVWDGNKPACKTYKSLGYSFYGTVNLYGGVYTACEKIL